MVSPALLIVSSAVIAIYATFVAATSPMVFYAESMRPATFTGGEEGVHSTAYVLTAIFLGILTLWRLGRLRTSSLVLMSAPLLTLILLFEVRTCWLMILCYIAAVPFIRMRKGRTFGDWITVPVLLGVAALGVFLSSAVVDYSEFAEFSSGRNDAYSERLEMIANRSPINILFGTGVGSEMMKSTVWWWEDKNSHNDFIDITIQTGLIGLVLTVAMLCLAAAQLDRYQLPLFLSFVISSAVSNGLLGRPFIAALLLSFMAVPAARTMTGGKRT
jgi:O-antigen ligase